MQVGVFQLLQTKQMEIESHLRYIEALRDYWIARTELEHLLKGHLIRTPSAALGGMASGADMERGVPNGGH
jgi:cobalt-zinc-cadmium efflux system outer membrane protein